ncbi:relaxase/mobilization nuclease domain-containing protein [Roseibium sp. TrichSKD4]|uniref:relaxase/mobilization nuclease domain-containing protein n=1 Tax=Roseibium sp. TrichSKD4 TaxID=744980 RepID=UPI0001E5699C|nr:relaxase/mobilization nuclease domain-containing protein [Roseibium sp. TrichSKD4]EFO30631.1 relaxase/mobilization nuclease domain-containing protein [Roseibium sp. TrichSKD4]
MILKGSQRGGAINLADHLMNDRENDHVTLVEVRGFVARDLHGALAEAYAISKGTKCEQFFFSLSLNPPKEIVASEQDLIDAANQAEEKLGLHNQPRAIVFHEKEGRRHAHVVWSRIDGISMKAIPLPHFKNKLMSLARDLYLEHGWELPEGLRRDGGKSPLNFTLAEWQQAKRLKLDPREIKQSFRDAWDRSDSAKAFQHALEDKGYFLAKGDRRSFVALDIHGEVFSVPRMLGIKTKEVKHKLGDPESLASVDDTKSAIARKVTDHIHEYIEQVDAKHDQDMQPLTDQKLSMRANHRSERQHLKAKQQEREQAETRARNARMTTGLRGLWDRVSGNRAKVQKQNEQEAWLAAKRDLKQRDELVKAQMLERRKIQLELDKLRRKHIKDRQILYRDITQAMRMSDQVERMQRQDKTRDHSREYRGPSL